MLDFSTMDTIVEIRDVTAWRGDTRVFEGLSLTVERGRSMAVLGPNGSGKTTLLKLLTQEIYPVHREGSGVLLFGREDWSVWKLRKRLGVVSHDLQTAYPDRVSAREVVLSGFHSTMGVHGHQTIVEAQRDAAEEALERLGMADFADRSFATLSTGEQRRVLLARALVHDPEVLVLDEPTSGMDLKACFEYLDRVRRLIRTGKTVVLATHHIHEIPPEIERVVLLKEGRVLADGPKGEVLTGPNLTELYDTPIRVVEANGFYRAVPGER